MYSFICNIILIHTTVVERKTTSDVESRHWPPCTTWPKGSVVPKATPIIELEEHLMISHGKGLVLFFFFEVKYTVIRVVVLL